MPEVRKVSCKLSVDWPGIIVSAMTNKIKEAVQQSSISISCCLAKKAHALLLSVSQK